MFAFLMFFFSMFFSNITKKEVLAKYEIDRTPTISNLQKMVKTAKSLLQILNSDDSEEDAKKQKDAIAKQIMESVEASDKAKMTKTLNESFKTIWGILHSHPELAFAARDYIVSTHGTRIDDICDYLIVEHTRNNDEEVLLSEADNSFALDYIVDLARNHFDILLDEAETVEEMEELTVKSNLPIKESKGGGYILSVSKKRGAPKTNAQKNLNVGFISCKILKDDVIVEEFDKENFDTVIFRHVNPLLGISPTTPHFVYSRIKEDLAKGEATLKVSDSITLVFGHPFKK